MRPKFNTLTLDEARRTALHAQGFGRPRPARPGARHIRETIRALGLVQVDCVNVLVPAHYQVLFSRLGPYDRALLDDAAYRSGEFTEQWAHEASIIPVETWPLLRHRMDMVRFAAWGFGRVAERHPEYAVWVLEQVRERGPLGADELPAPDGVERRIPGAWVGTVPRAVLESYFVRGVLAAAERRQDFSRVFDLAERRIPAEHFGRSVPREESERELLRIAARAHGVATAKDLADYFRMKVGPARPRIAELVEAGDLVEVAVDGWREAAYLHREAAIPRRVEAATILSPFDPLIWTRPRASRLFRFDYRVEIFVPAAKRQFGFYVLPFLLGDRLAARVDLKADRAAGRLMVKGSWVEDGIAAAEIAGPLARELWTLARWLGLERVAVGRRGSLARALGAAISSSQ
jgi:uncharacterized protein YcaQ